MTFAETGLSCEEQALRSLDRLPPFSPVLNRLLATLAREDVSFGSVADLIEKDTVMAANVLRLVNSALYGFRGTVNSVRHAVAILGINKLRNVVLSLSITRMWRHVKTPESWSGASFNLHSVATAILADLLVQRVPVPYPEGAFVGGLLHDIGKLLVAIAMPQEFVRILEMCEQRGKPFTDCETEVLGTDHAALSGAALAKWNLPVPIQRGVLNHHKPDKANHGQLDLSHVILAADQLAVELGHPAIPSDGGASEPGSADIVRTLGVTDRLPKIIDQFQPEFEALRAFF